RVDEDDGDAFFPKNWLFCEIGLYSFLLLLLTTPSRFDYHHIRSREHHCDQVDCIEKKYSSHDDECVSVEHVPCDEECDHQRQYCRADLHECFHQHSRRTRPLRKTFDQGRICTCIEDGIQIGRASCIERVQCSDSSM